MPLVKSVEVRITASGVEDAKLKIDQVAVKAEELKKLNPEITPKIDSAKALIEARLLRAGLKAEFEKSITETVNVRQSLISRVAGLVPKALMAGGEGLGNIPFVGGVTGVGGQAASNPYVAAAALAAVTSAAAALAVEATGIVAGLTAATAGVGAFGALALPTFRKITTAYTAISAAQKAYNQAAAIQAEDPTKTHATAAAKALLILRVAQESMGPSTRAAVGGMQQLVAGYEKMAKAFQPQVLAIFNQGLKIANSLLPVLKPFADAAAGAIGKLLTRFEAFVKSPGFQGWVRQFESLIGPSLTAVGAGAGRVTIAVGKLLTTMSRKDVVHALTLAFEVLSGAISAFNGFVRGAMWAWDTFAGHILAGVGQILRAIGAIRAALGSGGSAPITAGALGGTGSGGGGVGHRAAGGWASGLTLVGERGPELLSVPPGSYVYNHGQTQAMAGGNHYTIIQNIPPNADKRELGRVTVEAIRAFEQGSGHGWRK